MKKKVCVIGMGYVGFPLLCAIAKSDLYEVIGFDIDKEKIEIINKGESPVDDKVAQQDIKEINIKATSDVSKLENADFVLICVPTPVKDDKIPDLSPVKSATNMILPYMKKGQVIILESTVNPGICEEEILPILEKSSLKVGVDFDLAHCPERINPGDEKWNVYNIPRNVGSTSKDGTKIVADFYRSFITAEINEMNSLKAAEATKIVENTFRDINIAYVNELAKSFDVMGIDIIEVIKGASSKPFAFMAHYPSCGVGGHCIPVDPYYLIEKAKKSGFNHKFLQIAREINNSMPHYTVKKLMTGLNDLEKSVKGTNIGILGLSYKANVGDLRESPSLEIIKELKRLGANLFVCDPYVDKFDVNLCSVDEVISNCDAVILATNHTDFLDINDWGKVKLIIDGKNMYDRDTIVNKEIIYKGIGR